VSIMHGAYYFQMVQCLEGW